MSLWIQPKKDPSILYPKAGKPMPDSESIIDGHKAGFEPPLCAPDEESNLPAFIRLRQALSCGNPACLSKANPQAKAKFPHAFCRAHNQKTTFPRFPHALLLLLTIYTTTTYCRFGGSRHEV
jgi:hypothetical protein